jgi:hypothetical protein
LRILPSWSGEASSRNKEASVSLLLVHGCKKLLKIRASHWVVTRVSLALHEELVAPLEHDRILPPIIDRWGLPYGIPQRPVNLAHDAFELAWVHPTEIVEVTELGPL